MIGSCGKVPAVLFGAAAIVLFGGAVILIATAVFAIEGCATKPPEAPSPTTFPSDSQPSSSGPGVAVFDPNTGQTLTLPPDEAADAIRGYWTPERMSKARPVPSSRSP
jgi:hypothetical protein